MKKKLRYTPASGNPIGDISITDLKKNIYESKKISLNSIDWSIIDFFESEVNTYTGDSSFLFLMDKSNGCFIYYDACFIPIAKKISIDDYIIIELNISGDIMKIPSFCFKSIDETWDIIMDYINFQKKSEKYDWFSLEEVHNLIGLDIE